MPKKIKLEGEIGWEVEVNDIREQLDAANGEDVEVDIASSGGLISEGLKIYNELKNYEGRVDTNLTGAVASMASYIAMVGERRTAEKNAVFMIHNGSGLAMGDHHVMFRLGNHLKSLSNMIAKEYALKSDTSLPEIRAAMDETTFYYGDEIKEAGFVDEMIGDAEPEDRSEAVATATLMYNECQNKINNPAVTTKEIAALETMFAGKLSGKQKKEDHIKNNEPKPKPKQEEKAMTVEELKEKHPEIYDKIVAIGNAEGMAQGVTKERERVSTLAKMRAGFTKEYSQKVIDTAIAEGHELNQVTINLLAADQVAAEVEAAKADDVIPPANGEEAVEMKDGKMSHTDHVDNVSADIAKLPGVLA